MASDRAEQDVRRGVRRRDRGQRPTATKNPDTKQRRRRPSRRCSWARWSRLSHLAVRPHQSRHGYETASSHPVLRQKTFGETFGAATGVSDAATGAFGGGPFFYLHWHCPDWQSKDNQELSTFPSHSPLLSWLRKNLPLQPPPRNLVKMCPRKRKKFPLRLFTLRYRRS